MSPHHVAEVARKAAIARALAAGAVPKDERSLAELAGVEVVFLARTGTLTCGHPRVAEVVPVRPGTTSQEVLFLAMTLELRSDHPIAERRMKAPVARSPRSGA